MGQWAFSGAAGPHRAAMVTTYSRTVIDAATSRHLPNGGPLMTADDLSPPVGLLLAPTSERGRRTLDAVLDAAVRVFGTATDRRRPSVAAVAEQVDISPAAIYQYFPDRMALVLAAMERDCATLVRDALDRCSGEPYAIICGRFLAASRDLAGGHPLAVRAAFDEHRDVLDLPLVRRQFDRVASLLTEELDRARDAGLVRADIPTGELARTLVRGVGSRLWAETIGGVGPTSRHRELEHVFRLAVFCPMPAWGAPGNEDALLAELRRRTAAA